MGLSRTLVLPAQSTSHLLPSCPFKVKTPITAALGLLPYFAFMVSAVVAETHITAAEWAVATGYNDPYTCLLRSIPHYLTAAPSPADALQSAFNSYEVDPLWPWRLVTKAVLDEKFRFQQVLEAETDEAGARKRNEVMERQSTEENKIIIREVHKGD
ncbi:hypothetical protein B0T14DRAFT_559339 [Immersiella caudata]|uniref:Uncharacterized protein n=1 Tax=Immersiella caudata TaxID=314043 RepID=A0AA40CBK7_9PEZI|nr:hypothetical protein B0T14DRAFT_559339 [Immersiella caudata]